MRPFIFTKRCFVSVLYAFLAFSVISIGLTFALTGLRLVLGHLDKPASLGQLLETCLICLVFYSGLAAAAPITIPLAYILAVPALAVCALFGASQGHSSKTFYIMSGALVGISVFVFGGTAFFSLLIGLSGGFARYGSYESLFSFSPMQLVLFSGPMLLAGCVGGYHAWKSSFAPTGSPW